MKKQISIAALVFALGVICGMAGPKLSFAEGSGGVFAATEKSEQVYFNLIDPTSLTLSKPVSGPRGEKCKHPALAAIVNPQRSERSV